VQPQKRDGTLHSQMDQRGSIAAKIATTHAANTLAFAANRANEANCDHTVSPNPSCSTQALATDDG
jgi:hypothetical protein